MRVSGTPFSSVDQLRLLDGQLAWRQHDGGHEDRSNMEYFIAWADRMFQRSPEGSAK